MDDTYRITAYGRRIKDMWPDATEKDWFDWRWQIANRIRDLDRLTTLLGLRADDLPLYGNLISTYRYAVTPYYLSLIDFSDPADPIKKQCLPDPKEITFRLPGSNEDPLAEQRYMPVSGLIHRYPDRALILLTNMCAMYCR
ncbi:MAG: lysine 2,3-aminomutase, partial [Dissulfurimicrobium sp.]